MQFAWVFSETVILIKKTEKKTFVRHLKIQRNLFRLKSVWTICNLVLLIERHFKEPMLFQPYGSAFQRFRSASLTQYISNLTRYKMLI